MQKGSYTFNLAGDIERKIASNLTEYIGLLDRLFVDRFSIGQVGIARQELQYWKAHELISISDSRTDERVWSKVSYFDLCWLRIVAEMRRLGISIDEIKRTKNFFYHVDSGIADLIKQELFNGPAYQQLINSFGAEVVKNMIEELPLITDELNEFFTNITILILVLLEGAQAYLILIPGEEPDLLFLHPKGIDQVEFSEYFFKKKSFYAIYLNPIIDDSFASKKIKEDELQQMFKLSRKEKEIIKLLRAKDIKELKIRFDPKQKKGIVMVELVKEQDAAGMKKKLHDLLREGGSFKQFRIQLEDRNLVFIEETTKIKMDEI